MQSSHAVVVLAVVGLLGTMHVLQWATARPRTATRVPRLGRVLRELVGDRDPWTRALLVTALVAVSFAALAPLLLEAGGLAGRVFPE